MKYMLLITLMIQSNICLTQDINETTISDQFWNNEIVICAQDGTNLSLEKSIDAINQVSWATNCYGRFYRYNDLLIEPSTYMKLQIPHGKIEVEEVSENIYSVVQRFDPDTKEEIDRKLYYFKKVNPDQQTNFKSNPIANELTGKWIINSITVEDSISQYIDSCHLKYTLQIEEDFKFEQSYESEKYCTDTFDKNEIKQIHLVGEKANFRNVYHSLSDSNGMMKLDNRRINLRFNNGRIEFYEYVLNENNLTLTKKSTIIELVKKNDR